MSVLVSASCSSNNRPSSGGETHWLLACAEDRDCGNEGLSCICGTCTRACTGDDACAGEIDAACYEVESPALVQRCDAPSLESEGSICLAQCTAATDCTGKRTCIRGACVPLQPGELDGGAAGRPAIHVSDYDDVSANVAWSEPIEAPAPSVTIEGGDDRITGMWESRPCPGLIYGDTGPCHRFVISRSAAGEVTGAVQYYNFGEPTLGPFAPVTEPEVGYPTELVPEQYSTAMNFQPGVAYRLVDTRFENGVLTASWSSFDLWHEWCRLQEPHLWNVEGQGYYFCVSQDVASWAGMDEGKVALCRPLEFGPLCPGPFGRSEPCMCVVTNTTTCFGTVCRCTRDRCDADLRERVVVELTVDGEQMAGVYFSDASSFGPYEFSMERVAP